jgi:hypothetical protein
MNEPFFLSKLMHSDALFADEAYVMCYLRALAEQPIYGGDHPLNVQFHLLPSEAFIQLRRPNELVKLEKLVNCRKEEVFERLRDFLDEWDGVRLPVSHEVTDLLESDSETLLLGSEAHQIAARYLRCSPEGVLGTLFDSSQIYADLMSVSGGSRLANNDVYKLLRYLASQPNLQQKLKSNLYLRDWWEILESWVRPSVQAELAAVLSQETGHPVSKAFVLRVLFRLVKVSLNTRSGGGRPTSRYLQSTRLAMVLPEETSKFWQTLKEFSKEDSNPIKLDGLEQDNIARNSLEANVKEALRVADAYMQTYVQPVQQDLSQVDRLGMIALKHRFQGIVDELLSNALHYASLDSDIQNPFSYIQDAIRYYCHGEYKVALANLLDVSFLTLEQMGVECRIANLHLEPERDAPLVLFSAQDNSFLSLSFRKTIRPPRNVAAGELLIALQVDNRAIEILSLSHLEQAKIDEIRAVFPKSVSGLIDNGYTLTDRVMKTPLPISPDRQKINEALKEQIALIAQALVLSGTHFSLGRLIPSTDVFNRIPLPLPMDRSLALTATREQLARENIHAYRAQGMTVTPVSGT